MEGMLKVTPEKLIQTSGEFEGLGGQMKNLTGEMLTLIKSLGSAWQGEASAAYQGKFENLSGDMEKLYRMVQEHARDLQEMAVQYQQAEGSNTEQGSSLQNGVIV